MRDLGQCAIERRGGDYSYPTTANEFMMAIAPPISAPSSERRDTAAAWPKPAYAWYVVGVLLLAYVFSFIDRMILSLLVGPIRRDLQISDTEFSLLAGFAFAVFYTLLGLPLARLADRSNRRNLIAAGIAVWSTMTAACGLTQTFWGLFLARIGVGVGEATLSPSAYSLLSDYFPRDRLGRAMAVYSIGVPLGSGVALVIGATIVTLASEMPPIDVPILGMVRAWQITFFLIGLPGLAVAALMATVREPARRGGAGVPARQPLGAALRFVAAHRATLICHFGGLTLLVLVIYGSMVWMPEFFARSYGMARGTAGFYYGVILAAGGAIGLILGGMLADRSFARGRTDAHLRVIRWSVLATLPFLVAAPQMPSPELAFALLVPATLFSSIHGGIAGVALQIITPNQFRAQIIALYFFVANLIGFGLGPTIIAAITDFVFVDDAALRYSMSIVAAVALPLSFVMLTLGLGPFRRSMAVIPQ